MKIFPPFHHKLEQQLDIATRGFVDATVTIQPERNEVHLSQIFRWFIADFGGHEGLRQFLLDYLPHDERRQWLADANESVRFHYKPYNWRLNGM